MTLIICVVGNVCFSSGVFSCRDTKHKKYETRAKREKIFVIQQKTKKKMRRKRETTIVIKLCVRNCDPDAWFMKDLMWIPDVIWTTPNNCHVARNKILWTHQRCLLYFCKLRIMNIFSNAFRVILILCFVSSPLHHKSVSEHSLICDSPSFRSTLPVLKFFNWCTDTLCMFSYICRPASNLERHVSEKLKNQGKNLKIITDVQNKLRSVSGDYV